MNTNKNKATIIPYSGVMRLHKRLFSISTLLLSLIFIGSCTDNDPKYIAKTPAEDEFVLSASNETIVLNGIGAGKHTAVTFQWDSLVYGVSTPVIYTIQMDNSNGDFSTPLEEEISLNSYEISYSDSILNKKCLNLLKLNAGVVNEVKVRMKANMAFGNFPVYSNVLIVKITPFSVEKIISYLYMPGAPSGGWNNYSTKICSRNNNGLYEGYVKAAIWDNFKFTTNESFDTGSVFGSDPSALYKLSDNTTTQWNIWFDAAGYFLVKADLNTMSWSKTAITAFCVTGDFNSWSLTANPMTYDEINKVWTANCNISTIGFGIQIIGNGEWAFKYGDSDGGQNAGELTLGGANIMPTVTGIKTVTMDLSHPEKFTYKIE